jgi:hypothetical protein
VRGENVPEVKVDTRVYAAAEHDSDDEGKKVQPSKNLWTTEAPPAYTGAATTKGEVSPVRAVSERLEAEALRPEGQSAKEEAAVQKELSVAVAAVNVTPVGPTNAFVLPSNADVQAKASAHKTSLKRGRLTVRLKEAHGLLKAGKVAAGIDPFVMIRVGAAERFESKKSAVLRKTNDSPKFNNEIISFDLLDPQE